jgi:hypothetical protein
LHKKKHHEGAHILKSWMLHFSSCQLRQP